jgi:hypothetical protein
MVNRTFLTSGYMVSRNVKVYDLRGGRNGVCSVTVETMLPIRPRVSAMWLKGFLNRVLSGSMVFN